MTYAIGIDVGGTFTDIVVSTSDETIIAKAATTPADQSDGVLAGIALAAERLGLTTAALLGQTSRIVHGTTVATNALLEAKTAKVGLLTTAGHRDVIEMREGLKPERYNLRMAPPVPLVPRQLRLAVTERVRADGVGGDSAGSGVFGRSDCGAEGGEGRFGGDLLPACLEESSA